MREKSFFELGNRTSLPFGQTLTDREYESRTVDFVTPGLGAVIYIPGDPRTYGASLNYKF